MKNNILFLFIISFFVYSCSNNQDELVNLDTVKKVVGDYYESGRYDEECRVIIDDAFKKIKDVNLTKNSTVVFDIDETSLSNYNHIKEIGFGYCIEIWNEWLNKADGTALYHTKRFYDFLISQNVRIAFITGRYTSTREATITNLINQGYTQFDTLITRNEDELKIPATIFKAGKRRELAELGYEIIANIGDQWSDLEGEYSGIKIKLPNYLYLID